MIRALYLHIPFCRKICPFCAFSVRPDHPEKHGPYFEMVKQEFDLLKRRIHPDLSRVTSVYFGGGTPSRLTLNELSQWEQWLAQSLGIPKEIQWSIEVNPEDLTAEYADGLRDLGFNRISLGVQSFWNDGLQRLKRQHTATDAREAMGHLKKNGFTDINLDLMFAYPEQGLGQLQADLDEFISWNPSHMSAYCLNIEPKTAVYRQPHWRRWQDENEARIAAMYSLIVENLGANGLRQYEVSNFARKGFASRQNLIYWNGRCYLGLGMGAHSLLDSSRWGNCRRWADYRRLLADQRLPRQSAETLDETRRRDEMLMLSLRQSKGLNLSAFEKRAGAVPWINWRSKLKTLIDNGLVKTDGGRLRLTLEGMMLADTITAELSAALEL